MATYTDPFTGKSIDAPAPAGPAPAPTQLQQAGGEYVDPFTGKSVTSAPSTAAPVQAPPAPEEPGWFEPGSKSEAVVRGFSQAATMGFGDEIQAGVRSLLGQGDYSQLRDQERAANVAAAEANPGSSLAGTALAIAPTLAAAPVKEGAGAILNVARSSASKGTGGTFPKIVDFLFTKEGFKEGAKAVGGSAGRIAASGAKGAGAGAAYGGVSGLGHASGDVEQQLEQAGEGALTGAVVGGVAGAASGVAKEYGRYGDRVLGKEFQEKHGRSPTATEYAQLKQSKTVPQDLKDTVTDVKDKVRDNLKGIGFAGILDLGTTASMAGSYAGARMLDVVGKRVASAFNRDRPMPQAVRTMAERGAPFAAIDSVLQDYDREYALTNQGAKEMAGGGSSKD